MSATTSDGPRSADARRLRRRALRVRPQPRRSAPGTSPSTGCARCARTAGRSSIGASGSPLLYLLGIGLGLAAFIDAAGRRRRIARSGRPTCSSSRPRCSPRQRSRWPRRSSPTPSWRASSGGGYFCGINASPLSPGADRGGSGARRRRRACSSRRPCTPCWLFLFGAVDDPWRRGCAADLVGLLAGLAFGLPLMAYAASLKDDTGPVRDGAALRLHADVPVLRHVLPARRRCRCGCSGSAGSRRCGTPPSSAAASRTAADRARVAGRRARRRACRPRRRAAGVLARRIFERRLR